MYKSQASKIRPDPPSKKQKLLLCLSNQADKMISIKENCRQRGESIVAQGVLPFRYETGEKAAGMTAPG